MVERRDSGVFAEANVEMDTEPGDVRLEKARKAAAPIECKRVEGWKRWRSRRAWVDALRS